MTTETQAGYQEVIFFLNTVHILRTAGLVEEFTPNCQFIPVISVYLISMQQTALSAPQIQQPIPLSPSFQLLARSSLASPVSEMCPSMRFRAFQILTVRSLKTKPKQY